ncbi:YciI family protein [Pseudoroseomonas sp. WGS1072]|uniref:YciI family protein n=1 Tax=Roseomonas sp. WGS1072 TaxID=3366816 RepID=UPI003BF1E52A
MTECRLVLARASAGAGARIGAVREAHLALIRPLAEAGSLILGVPLLEEDGAYRGSLMLVAEEALERYLEAEPFRREGIWESHTVQPFRIAPLPYRPLPAGPVPDRPSHVVALARDGQDSAAPARRMAAREAHLARVRPAAAEGLLAVGGALLDSPGGRMIGSLAITAHPAPEAARAWWAADPYVTEGVWRDVEWHSTRFAPLPYRPLPHCPLPGVA